jgi:uncharacterized coiled-coil DUF342 family protein
MAKSKKRSQQRYYPFPLWHRTTSGLMALVLFFTMVLPFNTIADEISNARNKNKAEIAAVQALRKKYGKPNKPAKNNKSVKHNSRSSLNRALLKLQQLIHKATTQSDTPLAELELEQSIQAITTTLSDRRAKLIESGASETILKRHDAFAAAITAKINKLKTLYNQAEETGNRTELNKLLKP